MKSIRIGLMVEPKSVKISSDLHRALNIGRVFRGITLRAAVEQAAVLLLAAWECEDANTATPLAGVEGETEGRTM